MLRSCPHIWTQNAPDCIEHMLLTSREQQGMTAPDVQILLAFPSA